MTSDTHSTAIEMMDWAAARSAGMMAWETPPAIHSERSRVLSVFAPAADLDPLAFVQAAEGVERFFWSDPESGEGGLTVTGVGIAAELRVSPILDSSERAAALPKYRFEAIESGARDVFAGAGLFPVDGIEGADENRAAADHPARPRLFGGLAFQDDFVPDNTWSLFSPAQFILPHYQLVRHGGQTFLTISALVGPDEDRPQVLMSLREALLGRLDRQTPARRKQHHAVRELKYPMTFDQWGQLIDRAAEEIRGGLMEKVVLSRVCEVRAEGVIDAAAALEYLNEEYGDSFRFLFEPAPQHAFFGATPELLVRKTGGQVETMALAGSIARGNDPTGDEALADQLLSSDKERHEHRLVVEAIRQQLDEPTVDLSVPAEPGVLRLRNIQHLRTPIAGRLKQPGCGVLSLVRRLHPTPALGGVPVGRALAFLRENEPVPRGWYAGPIGWLDARGNGAFAVAIRSAVSQHDRAWLYAGAGIVADSQAEREWAETALKFKPMLEALGAQESG
jgi:menaquinone-specific isochorismate synthase